MSNYKHCKTCDDFHYDDKPCAPIYTAYDDDWLDVDGKKIHASSSYEAATKYAAYYNERSDYDLMNTTRDISIKDPQGKITRYLVSAEPSIDYHANEI